MVQRGDFCASGFSRAHFPNSKAVRGFQIISFVVLLGAMTFGCANPLVGDLQKAVAAPEQKLASADYPYGAVSASRATGVAPFFVQFSADFENSGEAARGFQFYEYAWDFGDAGSGTWGTNGTSKNTAKGGVAGHVFERQGSYTVTVSIKGPNGVVGTKSLVIDVQDPDEYYAGTRTICVSDSGSADFAGAPSGARLIATDDLSSITKYAVAGSRILFRRGSSWTAADLSWSGNAGPVTIGAYGSGNGEDALGLYANAPKITVTSGSFLSLDGKQDWRIMDLHLVDLTGQNASITGVMEMQRILSMRLKIEGFGTGLGWSHYNTSKLMVIDQMAVVSCDISNSKNYSGYVGGERLAVLGNILKDPQGSHVLRVWQAYRSVISNNILSGSSCQSTAGRHALKLHGPGNNATDGTREYGTPAPNTILLGHATEFAVVSGNVIGSSGPWPVAIGPQDSITDEALRNIVFERNRVVTGYGSQAVPVGIALNLWTSYSTVRNNVFDGTGSGPDYIAISMGHRGCEPAPTSNEAYNNTIYRADNGSGEQRIGIYVSAAETKAVVKNNLVSFPGAVMATSLLTDESGTAETGGNLLAPQAGFVDPDNPAPLARNFALTAGSPGIGQGVAVPVCEDFIGNARLSTYDIGGYER